MKIRNPFVCMFKWKFSETFSVLKQSLTLLGLACLRIKADLACHWKTL